MVLRVCEIEVGVQTSQDTSNVICGWSLSSSAGMLSHLKKFAYLLSIFRHMPRNSSSSIPILLERATAVPCLEGLCQNSEQTGKERCLFSFKSLPMIIYVVLYNSFVVLG